MKNENKKAAGYCRVKIGEQNEQSIEQQKYLINQYAEEYGYTITDWYCDIVWNDEIETRLKYWEMMKDVANGNVNGIIVAQLNRISENIFDFPETEKMLAKYNCAFVSVAEKLDDSVTGKAMTNILSTIVDFCSRQLGEADAPAEQ